MPILLDSMLFEASINKGSNYSISCHKTRRAFENTCEIISKVRAGRELWHYIAVSGTQSKGSLDHEKLT